eukprot:TRINITY_DN42266_c0_g1_i1.p1 TRINITY_DN42266_c0_g1~~TRINITY_DN42266_c0_g1_i1.p1  ORF type:complete len:250 (-),score=58.30 TRINITY_DN42266_c0_g1_i1:110-859(-)
MMEACLSAAASGLCYCMGYGATAAGPAMVGPIIVASAGALVAGAGAGVGAAAGGAALAGAAAAEGGAAAGAAGGAALAGAVAAEGGAAAGAAGGAAGGAAAGAAGGGAALSAGAATGIGLGVAAAAALIAGPLIHQFCEGFVTDPKCLSHDRCAGDCQPRNEQARYVIVTEQGIGKIYYYFFTCRSAAEAAMNSWNCSRILYDISEFGKGPLEQIAWGAKMPHNTIRGAMGRMLEDTHSEMQEVLRRST